MKRYCKICDIILLQDKRGLQLSDKNFICGNCKDEIINTVMAINERYVLTSQPNIEKEK